MRKLSLLALAAVSSAAIAQNPIFSNYSSNPRVPALNAATLTESGITSPTGGFWSELQHNTGNMTESNTVLGSSAHYVGTVGSDRFRLADDFVPGCDFVVTGAKVFCYATNITVPVSGGGTVKFWNGAPVVNGTPVASYSTLDATATMTNTDVFQATATATGNVFRIGGTVVPTTVAPNTARKINQNTFTFAPVTLKKGTTYWFDFQTRVAGGAASNFYPPVTLPGIREAAGANGMQYVQDTVNLIDLWVASIDGGNPAAAPDTNAAFPFILLGKYRCYPTTVNLLIGDGDNGGVGNMEVSDDVYYNMDIDTIGNSLVASCELISTMPVTDAAQVDGTFEISVGRPGLSYAVKVYDGSTNSYVNAAGGVAPTTDTNVVISALGAAAKRWVEDGFAGVTITFSPINDEDPSQDGWPNQIDLACWEVTPIPSL